MSGTTITTTELGRRRGKALALAASGPLFLTSRGVAVGVLISMSDWYAIQRSGDLPPHLAETPEEALGRTARDLNAFGEGCAAGE